MPQSSIVLHKLMMTVKLNNNNCDGDGRCYGTCHPSPTLAACRAFGAPPITRSSPYTVHAPHE